MTALLRKDSEMKKINNSPEKVKPASITFKTKPEIKDSDTESRVYFNTNGTFVIEG